MKRLLPAAFALAMAAVPALPQARPAPARPQAAQPATQPVCGGRAHCSEVSSFAAMLTDFRITVAGRTRTIIATVQFQNKTARPLILGFVQDAGSAVDDQGNRYVVYGDGAVRGIGLITRNNLDPKFMLQPGEASDARFEMIFRQSREILGVMYEIDLTVREIVPIQGNQFQLGREHVIRFSGLQEGQARSAPAVTSAPAAASPAPAVATPPATAAPATSAAPAPALPAEADPCAGRERCFSSGPFIAEVVQMTGSQAAPGQHHVVRINLRIRNVSSQPLVLAYKAKTSLATDNYGNPYYWGRAGTYDTSAQGIGTDIGRSVDSSFALRPGESRNATFQIVRYSPPRNSPIGTGFTWDLALSELEVLPNGQQVRNVREHSLSFRDLTARGAAAAAPGSVNESVKKLGDLFKKK